MVVQIQHLSRHDDGRLYLDASHVPVDNDGQPFDSIDDYCTWQDDALFFMSLEGNVRNVVLGSVDPGAGKLFAVASETDSGDCEALLLITEQQKGI
jgi:hypothetical protein